MEADGEAIRYIYDAIGQLTSFTRSDGQSESYAYDAAGNMLTKTQNGVQTTMRYNAANQLISSVSGGETTTYTYDANGNLVKSENAAGARSYTYNALNLLAKFTREDGYSESYTYNANRLLSSVKTSEDVTTTLTWDILYGDGVVIQSAQNGESTRFIYGLERISAVTGKNRTEYVYDGRGSVAAELIYNGKDLADTISKSYSPFGEQLSEAVSGFGYNGEYYNAATGMIYLRARFYAPELNRFSQKDLLRGSIFDGGSLNRYLYCQNDPVDFADYNGRQMCAACCLMDGDGCGGGGGGKIQKAEETIRSISAAVSNAASSVASVCSAIKQKVGESIVEFVQNVDGGARNTSPVAQSRPGMGAMSEYGRVPRKTITTDGPGVEGPTGGAYSCGIADDLNSLKRELKGDIKWVMEEVAKPTVKFIKQELEKVDLTFSIGANISGSPSFWSFNGQYFVTVDCKGNVAIQYSAMGGVTTGSPSCSISLVTIITDAPDYKKIEGPSGQIGGSYATFVDWLPLFVGGDFMFIPDESNDEMYNGISANFGIGTPGQETHVEWGETHTIEGSEFNIFDEAKVFYYYIIEWCER